MPSLFLSAGVPGPRDQGFYETADPFLIQLAVRYLVLAAVPRWRVIWGGHPAITPMVWRICQDLNIDYAESFVLYQSAFFEDDFPEENERFGNVELVDAVRGDREASLLALRTKMLSRPDLRAAVFVGGKQGVLDEYALFREYHAGATVIPVAASGGAALEIARDTSQLEEGPPSVDFARLFANRLPSLDG